MLTEKEAKEKWCPFARNPIPLRSNLGNVGFVVGNRAKDDDQSPCIASECMAWRWQFLAMHGNESELTEQAKGYCGLAGEPK